jgi:hypothetical protein
VTSVSSVVRVLLLCGALALLLAGVMNAKLAR